MKFDDISFSQEFLEDYTNAPAEVRSRTDIRASRWAIIGCLPPSAQAHRAFLYPNVWIVYLNKGKGGWRLLVGIENRMLTFLRLLNHDEMGKVLRK